MTYPIRILHIVTYMGRGGLETMLMNYYRHVDREKVQFDFLTHRDFKADYDDEIESLGGKIYHIPRLVPWSKSYLNALDMFFTEHPEYKIVHVHQDCLSSVILKVAEKHGVPVRIAHSHSSSQDKNIKYFIKLFYMRQIPQYATQLFACSEKAGDWMFGGKSYDLLNNAIDTSKYAYSETTALKIRREFDIAKDCFLVGHVGRFSYPKNHPFLIDIFNAVHMLDKSARLLLVGDGEGRKAIEEKVEQLGLQDCVIFTGVREDVPDLLQAMDAFVFPSLWEGLGIVAIEAQAAGLPCFISDKVPAECIITDSVKMISLKSKPEIWADEILSVKNTERKNNREKVIKAGYDIKENAEWLQNYYIEQWKANS